MRLPSALEGLHMGAFAELASAKQNGISAAAGAWATTRVSRRRGAESCGKERRVRGQAARCSLVIDEKRTKRGAGASTAPRNARASSTKSEYDRAAPTLQMGE